MGFGVRERSSSEMIIRLLRSSNSRVSRTNNQPQQTQEQLTAEQQKLMDESGKMLEYLRKEVFKLRGYNLQLKTDFDLLKDNNQRLMDTNASAGASFAALNQHAVEQTKHPTLR